MRSFIPSLPHPADRKSSDRPRRPARPTPAASRLSAATRAPNGLPQGLQTVMEAMSGFSLADVVVHRNSVEPARIGAAAFTKDNQIHLASGQDRHLPHEAWHAVQQKQGRVRPTRQVRGAAINDDRELEAEADRMGGGVTQCAAPRTTPAFVGTASGVIQRVTVDSKGLAVKLSASFEENHLATTEDNAKAASKNRANADGTLGNTVIDSSVDDFKTEMKDSEYDDWEADGDGYAQYFNWDNWYVTCEDTRQGKVVKTVEKAATDVQIGGYFNENDAEPNVKITHIGDS